MRFLLLRAVIALVALATFLPATAAELEDRKWIEVKSENFTILSRLSKKESINMLRHMELLRNVVSRAESWNAEAGVPTVIYAVKTEKEFVEVGADDRFAGMFISGLRNNVIFMRGVYGANESSIILHEYAHHLTNNADGYTYPKWYLEGYADWLGSLSIKRKTVELFGPVLGRLYTLQDQGWLPAELLLDSSSFASLSDKQIDFFYAQAWLLVHFLFNRKPQTPSADEGLRLYMKARANGLDEVRSFEEAFGIRAADLNARLKMYLTEECCIYYEPPIEGYLPEFETMVVTPDAADIALGLAGIALKFDNDAGAEQWYRVAAENDDTRARALAGLGNVLVYREEFDAAESYFEDAAALAPDDPEVLLDRSNYWLARALGSGSTTEKKYEDLAAAAAGYDYVESLGMVTPELLVSSARVMSELEVSPETIVAKLEAATQIMPSHVGAHADLAVAYANVGSYKKAIRVLQSILAWSHDQGLTSWARSMILQLQTYADASSP